MKMLRVLGLSLVLSVVAACGGGDEPQAAPDTLQRGLPTDAETLDQHKARSIQAADVLRDLSEGLVGYSADGQLIPAAAQSWDVSDDGLRYTFHLREGLRWSNGDALVAGHFVAGMRRLVDPATAAVYVDLFTRPPSPSTATRSRGRGAWCPTAPTSWMPGCPARSSH